jgi:tetraacyldisaccharide 4'-kinase
MPWTDLLRPLSPLYGAAVRLRARAYARGWLPSERLELPVISVGNVTFGGTGKTPTVIALARDLGRSGRRPAVLTRGYGRTTDEPLVVVGPEPGEPVERIGDEPAELARRLPGIPIVVDADRVRGGRRAIGLDSDVLLLDDGFQHLRLVRDLDLVLVDAADPWGGGRLPPRGRLREPLAALERASALLVTKLPPGDPGPLVGEIAATAAGHGARGPVLAARLRVVRVHDGRDWQDAAVLAGRRVLAFAGLGRPQGFGDLLREAGAEVVASRWFADHHRYSSAEVASVVAGARAAGAVPVTTGKDAVKLPADAPVWEVEVAMEPVAGSWDGLWDLLPGGGS